MESKLDGEREDGFEVWFKRVYKRDPALQLADDGGYAYYGETAIAHQAWWDLTRRQPTTLPHDDLVLEVAEAILGCITEPDCHGDFFDAKKAAGLAIATINRLRPMVEGASIPQQPSQGDEAEHYESCKCCQAFAKMEKLYDHLRGFPQDDEVFTHTSRPMVEGGEDVVERWKHVANEWSDIACNGLQYISNVHDEIMNTGDAIAAMQSDFNHGRTVANLALEADRLSSPSPATGAEELSEQIRAGVAALWNIHLTLDNYMEGAGMPEFEIYSQNSQYAREQSLLLKRALITAQKGKSK